MTNNTDGQQPDLEKQEDVKADRTRRLLKWAIVLSVIALLAIVGVAIPMALKVLPEHNKEDTSSSKAAANKEDSDEFKRPPAPTTNPTRAPVEPGMPTAYPTVATPPPSAHPTRSLEPTDDSPSTTPTYHPTTKRPTPNPTPLASAVPTRSLEPTYAHIDPNYSFKLRLFWQRGYYWQESFNEVWHCVECVRCREYGAVRNLLVLQFCICFVGKICIIDDHVLTLSSLFFSLILSISLSVLFNFRVTVSNTAA